MKFRNRVKVLPRCIKKALLLTCSNSLTWAKSFRIFTELKILRLIASFFRKPASKMMSILIASLISFQLIERQLTIGPVKPKIVA